MFVLFGWGHQTEKQHGPAIPMHCPRCNNDTFYHCVTYRTWFTFFFIPLIPYKTQHLLFCEVCSAGMALEPGQIERAEHLASLTANWVAKQISDDEYYSAIRDLPLLEGDSGGETQQISCVVCQSESSIGARERRAGTYVCSACGSKNLICSPLTDHVTPCSTCGKRAILDREDIAARQFSCPACKALNPIHLDKVESLPS